MRKSFELFELMLIFVILLIVFSFVVSINTKSQPVSKLKSSWVQIESPTTNLVCRTRTPTGWLVVTNGSGITYVPDPENQWLVTKPEKE